MKHDTFPIAIVASSHQRRPGPVATAWRLALLPLALLVFMSAHAEAAVSTWVAGGTTSNFSDSLNWDAPPTPDCDLVFAAGSAFASKGAPVNDIIGLAVNAIGIYEAYTISGNAISCKIINDYNATIATVALPLSTFGSAALTVTVTTAGATLNLSGLISGAGPVNYAGAGIKRLNGSVNNTLSGLTTVALGELVLDSIAAEAIAGPLSIDSGATVTLKTAPAVRNSKTVTVDGIFDLSTATGSEGSDTETIGGLLGTGMVTLGAKTLGCTAQAAATTFSGGFTGSGGFRQSASGAQVLSGNSSTNTGATRLAGGSLHIWGVQPASAVSVTAGTLVLANDCSVGDVTVGGGASSTLSFNETISAMNLHASTAHLTVGGGSVFQVVALGAAATLYSNVTATAVTITGAALTVDTSVYTPAVGSVMTIIDKTGAGAIGGTFAGHPEGATVVSSTNSGTTFAISYVGGTGNDVTLTGLTIASDITAPVISAVASGGITVASATVTWSTDEASSSQVGYGLTTAYGSTTTLAAGLVLSHSVPITGLAAGTLYHYQVLSRDAAGNLGSGADGTFTTGPDVTAPVISAIASHTVGVSSTTVTWSTNEVSDSRVEYGLTAAYGSLTTLDASLVLSHSVPIIGLAEDTVYHFRVISKDAAANQDTSSDRTFTTGASGGSNGSHAASSGGGGGCGAGGAIGLLTMGLLLSIALRPGRRGKRC